MEVTDEALSMALGAIESTGGACRDLPDFGDGLSHHDKLDVIDVLIGRGWITAATNYGDNRLLSAHNLQVTQAGQRGYSVLLTESLAEEAPPATKTTLDQKRALRRAIMVRIYEASDGSPRASFNAGDLAFEIGADPGATGQAVKYLVQEGLLTGSGWGMVSITHDGVVEVEQSLDAPDAPTAHFPPGNHITVNGSVIGSTFQQAGAGSTQSIEVVREEARSELVELFGRIRVEALGAFAEDSDERDELETELDVIDRQLASRKPKRAAVAASMERVAAILGTASSVTQNIETLSQFAAEIHRTLPGI